MTHARGRWALFLSSLAILAAARPASSFHQDDPPLELEPPIEAPDKPDATKPDKPPAKSEQSGKPADPATSVDQAKSDRPSLPDPKKPAQSAVLAIPGLTVAPRTSRPSGLPPLEPIGPADPESAAPLQGPVEMRPSGPVRTQPVNPGNRGLTLEPSPMDSSDPLQGEGARPRTVRPRRDEDDLDEAPENEPSKRRFLDRFSTAPARSAPPRTRGRDGVIAFEPRNDPAADAEFKRRIEKQVRQVGGDRLKTFDVKVVGKKVTIKAKANHFWQRRSLKHSIETLPALVGSRAQIDVVN